MSNFILGLIVLIIFALMLRSYMKANPAVLVKWFYNIGGVGAIVASLILLRFGLYAFAIPVAIWGAYLLLGKGIFSGVSFPGPAGQGNGPQDAGNTSSVKTAYLDMHLDHDTNDMDGIVLKGVFRAQRLSSLSMENILQLFKECTDKDPQSVQLLQSYLDRRYPDWRDHPDAQEQDHPSTNIKDGPLTREDAYEILGLRPGASNEEIRQAHRTLMKKFHPDQGGSTYLATKINEAKDLLLKD